MRDYGKCPICHKDFEDCSHTLSQVESYRQDRELEKKVEKIVDRILKKKGI